MTDLCGACRTPLVYTEHGARVKACGCGQTAGYWSKSEPLPRDAWFPVRRRGGLVLYRAPPMMQVR